MSEQKSARQLMAEATALRHRAAEISFVLGKRYAAQHKTTVRASLVLEQLAQEFDHVVKNWVGIEHLIEVLESELGVDFDSL